MDQSINRAGNKLASLSCFSDRGTVQKVIVLPRDDLQTEELVLEEVEVFKVKPFLFLPSLCVRFLNFCALFII